jgi:hypothetical protein
MKKISVLSLLLIFISSFAFAGTVNLPTTGQTNCYDTAGAQIFCTGTGQDGEIQAGVEWPSPRFTDNGDETMTDNLTGLMWTKNANLPNSKVAWAQALDYCNNLTLAGFTDWRLPNANELESLVNANEPILYVWLDNQGFTNVNGGYGYWSSTTLYASPNIRQVAIMNMDIGLWTAENGGYVWPVRGPFENAVISLPKTGQTECYYPAGCSGVCEMPCAGTGQDGEIQAGVEWPSPRFQDNGDGTVTDNLTGLVWTKSGNLPNSTKTWQEALDYVKGMNAGIYYNFGYTDWRLPNRGENYSLMSYQNTFSPGLPSGHPFINTAGSDWSSTTVPLYPGFAWADNADLQANKSDAENFHVWPVRGGHGEPLCTYSISPTRQSFPASGGTGSVSVSTQAGCSRTATSNASWITITSGSSGKGNGTLKYSVSANTSASQRTGTMTIAGATFTVTQEGALSECTTWDDVIFTYQQYVNNPCQSP